MESYLLDIPGLAERVAATCHSTSHAALLTDLRAASSSLGSIKLAATRVDIDLAKRQRQVLTASGALIHDDYREFLRGELVRLGDARGVVRALRRLNYRLGLCEVAELYLVSDSGIGTGANFIQVIVDVECEFIDQHFFNHDVDVSACWGLECLCDAAQRCYLVDDDERRPAGAPAYRLGQVINVNAFIRVDTPLTPTDLDAATAKVLQEADLEWGPRSDAARVRKLIVSRRYAGRRFYDEWEASKPGLSDAIRRHFTQGMRAAGRRFIDDWDASSAGRSGARLSDHWVLEIHDYTFALAEKHLDHLVSSYWVVPTRPGDRPPATDGELLSKIAEIDRIIGVPFAWFFCVVERSGKKSWAPGRVLSLADDGTIEMPDHDRQVLRRWQAHRYGF